MRLFLNISILLWYCFCMKYLINLFLKFNIYIYITIMISVCCNLLFFMMLLQEFNTNVLIVLIGFAPSLLLLSVFTDLHNLLGGDIKPLMTMSNDPHKWLSFVIAIPLIGSLVISYFLSREINILKREMKKQGVTNVRYFQPLPKLKYPYFVK